MERVSARLCRPASEEGGDPLQPEEYAAFCDKLPVGQAHVRRMAAYLFYELGCEDAYYAAHWLLAYHAPAVQLRITAPRPGVYRVRYSADQLFCRLMDMLARDLRGLADLSAKDYEVFKTKFIYCVLVYLYRLPASKPKDLDDPHVARYAAYLETYRGTSRIAEFLENPFRVYNQRTELFCPYIDSVAWRPNWPRLALDPEVVTASVKPPPRLPRLPPCLELLWGRMLRGEDKNSRYFWAIVRRPELASLMPSRPRQLHEARVAAQVGDRDYNSCGYLRKAQLCPLIYPQDIEEVVAFKRIKHANSQGARDMQTTCSERWDDARHVGEQCAKLCGLRRPVFKPRSVIEYQN